MYIKKLLEDLLPAKARLVIYLLVALAALAWAAWQAADGDLLQFIGGLIVALQGGLAAGNTKDPEQVVVVERDNTPGL